MLKKLILPGLVLAIADPILLYLIYAQWGIWPVLGVTMLAPWVIMALSRLRKTQTLGGALMDFAAHFLLFYPGPLTTIVGALLLIPRVQMILQAWAMRRFMNSMVSGESTGIPGMGGFTVFHGMSGMPTGEPGDDAGPFPFPPPAGPRRAPGGLKRAEGRIIDTPPPELPPPDSRRKRKDRNDDN